MNKKLEIMSMYLQAHILEIYIGHWIIAIVSILLIALLEELYKESWGGAQDGPVRKSSAATE